MIQAEMHWTIHSNVHWLSDFEDLHEKQTVKSTTSQLSEHSIIIINSYILVTSIKSTHERLYAIYIEWTKLSEIENYSLFIQLLHAVKTIVMRLCIKLVCVDCMLENEWFSHFKLLQKLYHHHHSCSCSEILRDSDDYLIVQEVNVS